MVVPDFEIEQIGIKVTIYAHAVFSDSAARAKVCNCTQYKGKNGCLFCLDPGYELRKNKRIYPKLRIKEIYRT